VSRSWAILALLVLAAPAVGQDTATAPAPTGQVPLKEIAEALPALEGQQTVATALKWLALVTVLSLAPAILVMVTSFTRIAVVLGLLRQALATYQLPPNQILFALSLLMTLVVMAPVYKDVHASAIEPYFDGRMAQAEALQAAQVPVRDFMIRQIEGGDNTDDVYLFLPDELAQKESLTWKQVPTLSLLPAFVISELKIAFLIGFRIFLPFLVIDMLVASVLVSMGMLMLPPVLISLPFKLLLFVLADGWHLVVGTLMNSFQ